MILKSLQINVFFFFLFFNFSCYSNQTMSSSSLSHIFFKDSSCFILISFYFEFSLSNDLSTQPNSLVKISHVCVCVLFLTFFCLSLKLKTIQPLCSHITTPGQLHVSYNSITCRLVFHGLPVPYACTARTHRAGMLM